MDVRGSDHGSGRGHATARRTAVGFVVLLAAILVVNVVLGVGPNLLMRRLDVSPDVRAFVGSSVTYGLRILAYLVLPAVALRRVLGVDPWARFLPLRGFSPLVLAGSASLVAGVLACLFVVEVWAGWLVIEGWTWQRVPFDAWLRTLWVGFLVNVAVALGEESLFRGYLLTGLAAAWGTGRALVVTILVFGGFHLLAYRANGLQSGTLALAIVLAGLFGGLFGIAYLRSGSLWLPVVVHFTWNLLETDVFNLAASTRNANLVGAITRLREPLTSTRVGPTNVIVIEAAAFLVISAGILWLARRGQHAPIRPGRRNAA